MGLPVTPNLAWDAVQASLVAPKDISGLRAAIFPAANDLWRFVVTSTLHGIWIERLRRMEFPSLPPEAHNASARTHLRRAITSFRNLTYQPGADDANNNVAYIRLALAGTLLQNAIPPGLNLLEQGSYPRSFYLKQIDGGSRGNPRPGFSGSVIVKMQFRSHAVCVIWIAGMAYGRASTTNNYAEYQGLLHGLH